MPNNNVSVQRNGGFLSDTIQNDCLIFITGVCCSTRDLSPDPLPPPPSAVSNHGVGYRDVGGILRSFFTFFFVSLFIIFIVSSDVQNEWEENTHTSFAFCYFLLFKKSERSRPTF